MNRRSLLAFALVTVFAFVSSIALGADKADKADKPDKKKPATAAVKGVVKSVDGDKITLTVKVKKETEEKTFAVGEVKVQINGEKKTLADVTAGLEVTCKLSEDGKSIVAINSGKKPK
ncbi:MAG: hypothetical protein WD768_02000 [Phycisphaeraceae bacterium]